MEVAEIVSLKWGGVYMLRYKGLLSAARRADLKQAVDREAERLGVRFIVLDESFELLDGAPLYETPQFAAAVEAIARRWLATQG
jgi:hypothetical protein